MNADDPRHGTRRGYYAHRKDGEEACAACKRGAAGAEARYAMLREQGKVSRLDPIGVQRRVQALAWLGYTWARIDTEIGLARQAEKWGNGEFSYVYPRTHARIDEAFRRLCMTLPPETTPAEKRAAARARNRARRKGWAPPLAWDNIDDPNEKPKGHERQRPTPVPDRVQGDSTVRGSSTCDPAIVARVLAGEWRLMDVTRAERLAVIAEWRAYGMGSLAELNRRTGWNAHRDLRLHVERGEQVAS